MPHQKRIALIATSREKIATGMHMRPLTTIVA
jgi:hypothetical protein